MRDDRRKSRRIPVLADQQRGTLRVGDVSISVRVLDQSSTGFAIRAEEHPGVFPGEVVWLQTQAGWSEVRVVKTRHEVEGTQIGLERIADVAAGPDKISGVIPEQLAQDNPRSNHWPLWCMIGGLCVVLGFLVWTAFDRQVKQGLDSVLSPPEFVDSRPAAVRAIENEATRRASELKESIKEFGAAMLALPEVVETLKLSADQQQQLKQIVQAAVQQEQDLRSEAHGGGGHLIETQVHKLRLSASQEALQLLNAEQKQQWQAMFDAALERLQGGKPSEPGQ
jgi:hypothetical protein